MFLTKYVTVLSIIIVSTAWNNGLPAASHGGIVTSGSASFVKRQLESIPQILTNATNQLQAGPLQSLSTLTVFNATPFVVNNDLIQVNTILADAHNKATMLDGQPLATILLDVGGAIIDTISDVAHIADTLVSGVVTTLQDVDSKGICLSQELVVIDSTLASLISETTNLIDTLLSLLTSLTQVLLPDLNDLQMTDTESALGLT